MRQTRMTRVPTHKQVKVLVHYPRTEQGRSELCTRIAKFHANYVAWYIEKLSCPTEQKLRLLDAIVETLLSDK